MLAHLFSAYKRTQKDFFFFCSRDVSNNIILLQRRNKFFFFFYESPTNNYYLFPKHLEFFPQSASCNHQKLKKTKTWSCTQLSTVISHPEHMERKWHHSVTWSRSSGTPKQAFYSTPFTHRETSRLRRFSTLLWGLPQNYEDSPHRNELFLMVPPTICGEFGYVC